MSNLLPKEEALQRLKHKGYMVLPMGSFARFILTSRFEHLKKQNMIVYKHGRWILYRSTMSLALTIMEKWGKSEKAGNARLID